MTVKGFGRDPITDFQLFFFVGADVVRSPILAALPEQFKFPAKLRSQPRAAAVLGGAFAVLLLPCAPAALG